MANPVKPNRNKRMNKLPPAPNWRSGTSTLLFWVIIFMLGITLYQLFSGGREKQMDIIYSQFREEINAGNITQVTFYDREVKGKFKTPKVKVERSIRSEYPKFKTYLPIEDPGLIAELESRGIQIKAENTAPSPILSFLMNWGFLIVIGVLWFVFMRQMQGGQKGVFSFGKSKAKLLSEDRIKITFSDVAGADEAKDDLQEIIGFLKEPKKFTKLGGKIPKGALLLGPPGTGKTLLAKAVAGEAGVPLFRVPAPELAGTSAADAARRVRLLFDRAAGEAPCVVMIEDLEGVARRARREDLPANEPGGTLQALLATLFTWGLTAAGALPVRSRTRSATLASPGPADRASTSSRVAPSMRSKSSNRIPRGRSRAVWVTRVCQALARRCRRSSVETPPGLPRLNRSARP